MKVEIQAQVTFLRNIIPGPFGGSFNSEDQEDRPSSATTHASPDSRTLVSRDLWPAERDLASTSRETHSRPTTSDLFAGSLPVKPTGHGGLVEQRQVAPSAAKPRLYAQESVISSSPTRPKVPATSRVVSNDEGALERAVDTARVEPNVSPTRNKDSSKSANLKQKTAIRSKDSEAATLATKQDDASALVSHDAAVTAKRTKLVQVQKGHTTKTLRRGASSRRIASSAGLGPIASASGLDPESSQLRVTALSTVKPNPDSELVERLQPVMDADDSDVDSASGWQSATGDFDSASETGGFESGPGGMDSGVLEGGRLKSKAKKHQRAKKKVRK